MATINRKRYKNIEKIIIQLGDDLSASITKAAWLSEEKKPQLHGPTYHMMSALNNWEIMVHEQSK